MLSTLPIKIITHGLQKFMKQQKFLHTSFKQWKIRISNITHQEFNRNNFLTIQQLHLLHYMYYETNNSLLIPKIFERQCEMLEKKWEAIFTIIKLFDKQNKIT